MSGAGMDKARTRGKETPMQVLSLGMSRTGTSSIKAALEILGHQRVHHAYELYAYPEQADQWTKAWDSKVGTSKQPFTAADWDDLLGPYSAVTDMPAVCFAPELLATYPDAKVILVERDPESWFKSFKTGVIDTFWDQKGTVTFLSYLDPELMRPVHHLWERLFANRDGYFHAETKAEMEKNSRQVYEEHYARVRQVLKGENAARVLNFDLKDGWEPLCQFLGTPKPDVPFPVVNEGDAIKGVVGEYINRSMKKVYRNVATAALLLGVSIYAIRRYWR